MVSRLRIGPEEYELLERSDPTGADRELVELADQAAAEAFVRRIDRDRSNRDELFALLGRHDPVAATMQSGREKLERAARLLAKGDLRLARRPAEHWEAGGAKPGSATLRATESAPKEASWLELRVVDDESGRPYADVKLAVTLADDSVQERSTDADGTISFPSTKRGIAKATSEVPDAGIDQTLAFVGMGERARSDEEPEPLPAGPYQIRPVTEHRVRSGETLAQVAERNAMSWQALAKFNWGTSSPAEVNKHLRFELGCTKKDAAGHNRVFDDADEPGLLYVPRPFRVATLTTDHAHSLRVRRIRPVHALRIDDPFLGFVGETAVELRYADGSSDELVTDGDGVVEVKTDRFSDRGNYADVKLTTALREHTVRVFLVLEHPSSRNGAWQRLANLGYVPLPEPTCEPESDELLAAALEEFQADAGLTVTGTLDRQTERVLAEWHRASRSWGEHGRFTMADPDDAHTRSKAEVA